MANPEPGLMSIPLWALLPSVVSKKMGARASGALSQGRVQDDLQWGHTAL